MSLIDLTRLKELFRLNMLTLDRQNQSQKKNKKKKKDKFNSLLATVLKSLGTGLILSVIYIPLIFTGGSEAGSVAVYDSFVLYLIILGFLQTFTVFYASLYESKDLESLMALPVTSLEIYLSKILTVTMGAMIFILPIVAMTFTFNHMQAYPIGLNILFNIYFGLVLSVFYIFINIVFMEILSYSGILYRFRSSVMTFLNVLVQFGAILFIVIGQRRIYSDEMMEATEVSYGLVSGLIHDPSDLTRFFVISFVVALVSILVIVLLGRNFVSHYQAIQTRTQAKKAQAAYKKGSKSLRASVYRYKLKLINNNTVISVAVVGVLITALIPMFSLIMESQIDDTSLVFLAILLAISTTYYVVSLARNIVSLDSGNFSIIKTWPISMADYLKFNAEIATIIMSGISIIIITILALVFGVSIPAYILAVCANVLLTYGLSLKMVYLDYNNLYLEWQTEADLFGRVSKLRQMVQLMGIIFVATLIAMSFLVYSNVVEDTLIWAYIGFGGLLLGLVYYLIYSDKISYVA